MNGKIFWFVSVFVLSAMLTQNLGYAQGPTPGRIPKFVDNQGNLDDSVIAASDSGNIGIGTTTPVARLDVVGTVNASTQYNIAGQRVVSIRGNFNTFVGVGAGVFNTTGGYNAFFGASAGVFNTTGSDNASFGAFAGILNTTGSSNAFFGSSAGGNNTTGSSNAFFGNGAGTSNTTENNNTFIGTLSNGIAGITNATALGAGAVVTQSNSLVLGNKASVGLGTSAPQAKLHVEGGDVYVSTPGNGIILRATDGPNCFRLTVNNSGMLDTQPVLCP